MYSITLQNAGGDNVITSGDILGRINFAVPSESDGAAATYIASQIYAQAEGSFTSASNPASLILATSSSDSAPATGRLKVSSDGHFIPLSSGQYDLGSPNYHFRNIYADNIIGDYSGQLDGNLDLNGYGIVGTGNITIDGNVTAEYFYGDLDGVVVTECRNDTGSTIAEGTPVYVVGYYSSNGKPLVAPADCANAAKMPAIGLLASELTTGSEGHVHVFGLAQNLPSAVTNGFSVGNTVYVDNGGGLTNVRPTGVSELVQNIGRVLKTGTNGRILVLGPGRSNDVPNSGHFEQLTVDGYTALALDNGNVGIGTASPQAKLDVNGTVEFDDLVRWEYPDKALDPNIGTLGYLRTYDESDGYCGLGISTSSFNVGTSGAINLRFVTDAVERIIVDYSGNVGIGKPSPSEKLDVSGGIGHVGWKTFRYIDTAGPNGSDNGFAIKLNDAHGTTLNTQYHYRIRLTTDATATTTGATYLVWYKQATSSWEYRVVSWAGSISNHCLLAISGSNAIAYTNHPSTSYDINCVIESYHTSNQYSLLHSMGSDYQWQRYVDTLYYNDGNVGVGTSASVTSRFQVEGGDVAFNQNNGSNIFKVGSTASDNLLYVDGTSNDKVGIGTASPISKLDIRYPAGDGMALIKDSDSNDGLLFGDMAYSTSDAYQGIKHVGMTGSSDYMLLSEGTHTLMSAKGTAGRVYIRGGGNYSFNQILVYGSSGYTENAAIELDAVTGKEIVVNQQQRNVDFRVESNTNEYLLFTDASTDRVGIGTPSPSYKLDVNGTFSANSINVNDEYTFPTTDGSADQVLVTDGNGVLSWEDQSSGGTVLNETVNGRLTLESGEPVSTTNQTAKTTLYFTPYKGNQIALYNGTAWGIHSFSELSLSLSGYTANTNYDIFIYDNSGTLTLESIAWTNDTTRATSLTIQDGVYVKSGATTRRYLGTIRTTSASGQCEDSQPKRFVWNYYNKVFRRLDDEVASSNWTYTTNTWRVLSGTASKVEIICGIREDLLDICQEVFASTNATPYYSLGISVNGSADPDILLGVSRFNDSADGISSTGQSTMRTKGSIIPRLGYSYYNGLERNGLASSITIYVGTLSGNIITGGMRGQWKC